jgi:peptidoglycan-associated lipoprotein
MSFRSLFSVAPLVLALGMGFTACTQDEEPVEEVVTPDEADSPGAPDDVGSLDAGSGVSGDIVYFAFDDYTLSSDAQTVLNKLADNLRSNAGSVVQIQGHCDERGSIEYNLALGERRANSVKNYLSGLGIEGARLNTISFGEEKPVDDGHDEAAWARNRRAEFVISGQ